MDNEVIGRACGWLQTLNGCLRIRIEVSGTANAVTDYMEAEFVDPSALDVLRKVDSGRVVARDATQTLNGWTGDRHG